MAFVRWRPSGDLLDIYGKINRLFEEDLMKEDCENQMAHNYWIPATDIYETHQYYVFKIELPGICKEDVSVELNGDNLVIKGEIKEEQEADTIESHRIERYRGTFSRTFHLPKNANGLKVAAAMNEGILELRVPKEDESDAISIAIN